MSYVHLYVGLWQEREASEARETALAALEERSSELMAAAGAAGAPGGAGGALARAQQRLHDMEVASFRAGVPV